ncbi:MAG: hypothetical protein EZS28_022957 [Streblomastix strix]|uniref:Uncharacterized protein n=1 Tax=Streblomastix strix TaxID=222440 RepID=A0A5J4VGB9_9EUKA|nr:MAG: hypothetical protein EZS28_022957 [Streblomastix strix]
MEKDCTKQVICESEVPCKLLWILKLSKIVDQVRRNPIEEIKQGQNLDCVIRRMELNCESQHVTVERDILVENNDSEEQANLNYVNLSTCDLSNGCVQNQLGSHSQDITPRLGNPREAAGSFCSLRHSETYLKERQIRSLKMEADNCSTAYNINRGSAAITLVKLTDRILETAEDPNLQLHIFHIPGKLNVIPDSLSRFTTSGDYQILQYILMEALFALQVNLTIYIFANRRNSQFTNFITLVLDNWATGYDCLSHPWTGEVPYLHVPISMIQATLNKTKQYGVPAQAVKYDNVGRSEDVLKPGGWMQKAKKHRPPKEILEILLDKIKVNSYSCGSYPEECLHLKPQTKRLKAGAASGDINARGLASSKSS